MKAQITIPESVTFSDLALKRLPSGEVSFSWTPIDAICEASGIDPDLFRRSHEDNVAGLLVTWYGHHLASGGERNPVAEELLIESQQELN